MMTKTEYRCFGLVGLCMVLTLLLSCGHNDQYAGVYRAEGQGPNGRREIVLDLYKTGLGTWTAESEKVPLLWRIKRGQLRIHTRGGGVIVGKIEKDTIQIALPGFKAMTFKKIQ